MRKHYKEDLEFGPDEKGKTTVKAVRTKNTTNKATKGKGSDELTSKQVLDKPSKTDLEYAKGVYGALKNRGKLKDVNQEFKTNPKPDVVAKFSGDAEIHPDNGKPSYTISAKEIDKYAEDIKKIRRRMRESENAGKHTITFMYEPRLHYEQYDISDRAFDYQFDDWVLYNSNYGFNPLGKVADAVETDFEELGPTGLAQYIDDYEGDLKDYVESIIGSFDPDKEILYMDCVLKEGTDPKQIIEWMDGKEKPLDEALKSYIDGQISDGWGEGFEQQEIDDADCWCAYNTDDEEDCQFYGNERDAVNEAEANTYEEETDDDGDVVEEACTWDWCKVNVRVYCSFYDHSRDCYKGCLIDGVDENGYDRDGYDKDGYNSHGRNKAGFDKEGYNAAGYDKDGFDRTGYDRNGRDKGGFDKSGVKPMNNKRPTDKSGREQGAKFNLTKDGKVRIANTFDMGEAVKLSKKRVAEAKKILAKNNKLTEAEVAEVPTDTPSIRDSQLFAFIRGNEDWIAIQCGEYGIPESSALITFDPSMIGGYYALEDDGSNISSDVEIHTLAELQALPYPPNIVTIVGESPYIEDLDEWLSETEVGDLAYEEMDMGEKAAEIAFNLSDIFNESKIKKNKK